MAWNDSGPLSPGESYSLGDYTFDLRSHYDEYEGVTGFVVGVNAYGVDQGVIGGGHDVDGEAEVLSWRMEANDVEVTDFSPVGEGRGSEFTFYATVQTRRGHGQPVRDVTLDEVGQTSVSYYWGREYWPNLQIYADFPARVSFDQSAINAQTSSPITLSYYEPKDIYCADIDITGSSSTPDYGPVYSTAKEWYALLPQGHASEEILQEIFVARMQVFFRDAGGGPDGDWDEPGDVEPEGWEPGEPTHTLHVTVNGSLSGRHNDPLNDTSYSYLPADQDSVPNYGCGGDGGHGGGGGAGASTVIVRRFATDRASSKVVAAYAKRHGYGSGGGKGGKGGDGCILIFY